MHRPLPLWTSSATAQLAWYGPRRCRGLAKAGVLVMRGGKIDVAATDTVLDDKPVDDIDAPPPIQQPAGVASPPRPADGTGQGGATFGQARTIEMVFRAKLRRLEFETKQEKLIEAEVYRKASPQFHGVSEQGH